jgi:hypothetical protein
VAPSELYSLDVSKDRDTFTFSFRDKERHAGTLFSISQRPFQYSRLILATANKRKVVVEVLGEHAQSGGSIPT